jgi:hypothetical protein
MSWTNDLMPRKRMTFAPFSSRSCISRNGSSNETLSFLFPAAATAFERVQKLLPELTAEQRRWLREALSTVTMEL